VKGGKEVRREMDNDEGSIARYHTAEAAQRIQLVKEWLALGKRHLAESTHKQQISNAIHEAITHLRLADEAVLGYKRSLAP